MFPHTRFHACLDKKRKLSDAIRAEKSLITNARCLTEVDVKEIDGYFADPKGGTIA